MKFQGSGSILSEASASWAREAGLDRALRFPLHFSERRLLLIVLDLITINTALILALGLRSMHPVDFALVRDHPFWFMILTSVWLGVAVAFDVYEPRVSGKLVTSVPAVVRASILTVFFYLLIPYVTPPLPTSRMTLVSFPLLAVGALLLGRVLYAWGLPRPMYERRVLIVGAGWAGHTVARVLHENGQVGYHVVGFIDDDANKIGRCVPVGDEARQPQASLPVLGNRRTLKQWIAKHRISTVILAITGEVDADLLHTLMDCVERRVEMVPMPVIYEQLTGRVSVGHVGEKWYAAIPIHSKVTSPIWRVSKRAIDIVVASVGLSCLLPFLPFVALAIVLDSPGPVLYTQVRVGKGGRLFRAHKFRSMFRDAEHDGAVWARERDPRVTRVGRILRATHVDELPQFLNVLKGEMSIVGPRPERPEFVEGLVERFPVYRLRHIVKPGMGGWGLIQQGYADSPQAALVRLEYDLYYIKHQSFWLDTLIMLKTIMHALSLKGR